MLIAPATPDDLKTLIGFRDEAARWLKGRGIDQWSAPWPTQDLMEEGMLRSILAGETFIVWDDDTPAATLTVDHWANPDLWTPVEAAEPALYTHKVTVARAYAGRGLGRELLDWAGTRAANEGARWLRLDAWTTNRTLQQYYLDQGFSHVRTVVLAHNPSGALFQRPAARVPMPHLQEAPAGREHSTLNRMREGVESRPELPREGNDGSMERSMKVPIEADQARPKLISRHVA